MYEVIVVGAGHAGCEAALATSRMNHKTLLITGSLKNIATMPCNPSIGGSAKGVVVREIDALGGEMGKAADKTHFQIKMLNNKKGPAVQALRAQVDKVMYPKEMLQALKSEKNLEILEGIVEDLMVKNKTVCGVVLKNGTKIESKAVILTTGTYMKADILVGSTRRRSGPMGQEPCNFLSENLEKMGFKVIRLKTGTPQRIQKDTIDFSKAKEEKGDDRYYTFSFENKVYYKKEEQLPCYLIYTNEKTHEIIKKNLNKSSIYGGRDDIRGVGPRYCPSIEDKIVKFSDKERHQLFLEPESLYYDEMYLQGFSTSMPEEVQEAMVHSLEGLENAKILKYAYAIEYDAIYPTQLKRTLETKLYLNLYTAGQINGTSGYEEAACQGLMAGINASLKLRKKKPLILRRDEAYIGVLIDDLVTKGVKDPYRLLTSRAEHRLLLRNDNADARLSKYGYKIGLLKPANYQKYIEKSNKIKELEKKLKQNKIKPTSKINKLLTSMDICPIKKATTLYELIKRQNGNISIIKNFIDIDYEVDVIEEVEIQNKYEGYIKKAILEASKMKKMEDKKIPKGIDYTKIKNLASEAKQKLAEIQPTSIGQASRISGVNPSDIAILSVYIKKEYNE